jgi:hypothetical protein
MNLPLEELRGGKKEERRRKSEIFERGPESQKKQKRIKHKITDE